MRRALCWMLLLPEVFLIAPHAPACAQSINVEHYGATAGSGKDATAAIEKAIAAAKEEHSARLIFPKGRYDFWPMHAALRRYFISNHDVVAERSVAMPLEDMSGMTIDGQGSEFVFHDSILPLAITNSSSITLRNFSIDYVTPHVIAAKVIRVGAGWVDIQIADRASYTVANGRMVILGEDFRDVAHSSVVFNGVTRALAWNSGDNWNFFKTRAQQLGPGTVRLTGLAQTVHPGEAMVLWSGDRPNPAVFVSGSRGVAVDHVTVHSAQGMGFLAQRSQDVHLDAFDVALAPGSTRYVTTIADAVHFSNCRGQITVENGLYENMLDDGINVHGSYLRVTAQPRSDTVLLAFGHPQSFGFPFADPGDHLRFVHSATLLGYADGTIKAVTRLDDKHLRVQFNSALPSTVHVNDAVENLDWQPSVVYRHNHIRHNRARGTLFGTLGGAVVEDNFFDHLSGPAILMSADASFWFESAPARNVVIQGNRFLDTNIGNFGPAPIWITPPFQPSTATSRYSVRDIRIENNTFTLFEKPIVYATSTENLSFKNNTVRMDTDFPAHLAPNAPAFLFRHARCVSVEGNTFPSPLAANAVQQQDASGVEIQTGASASTAGQQRRMQNCPQTNGS